MDENQYDDETRYKRLSNGAIYDLNRGRIVEGAPITSAHGSALAKSRWERYRESAAAGLAAAGEMNNKVDAWQWIVEKQAIMAADTERGRASTEAARFVARAIGAFPDKTEQDHPGERSTFQPGIILGAWLDDLRLFREQITSSKDE